MARAGALAAALLIGVVCVALAQPTRRVTREYDLKAAFLYHFAHFVTWPAEMFPSPMSPFTIGILGEDPFGPSLDALIAGESIGSHPLVIRRFASVAEVVPCPILFVAPSEEAHLTEVLARVKGRGVLTVGDVPEFAQHSGVIGFAAEQRRLRLEVNLAAAEAAELEISSKLLRQARLVGPSGDVR